MNWFEIYALFGSPLLLLAVGAGVAIYLDRSGSPRRDLPAGE